MSSHWACPVKCFQSAPHQYTPWGGGVTEIRNFCFQPPPGAYWVWFQSPPTLWWLTGLWFRWWSLTVKVDKTYRCCCHFYSWGVTFTLNDKTYRRCPVCTYLSFITNCKGEDSACKFHQHLQLRLTTIRLTITRGGDVLVEGAIENVTPGTRHASLGHFGVICSNCRKMSLRNQTRSSNVMLTFDLNIKSNRVFHKANGWGCVPQSQWMIVLGMRCVLSAQIYKIIKYQIFIMFHISLVVISENFDPSLEGLCEKHWIDLYNKSTN